MKLQKTFGLPLVVLFLALSGLSRSYAQDQGVATPQTPTDQAATAPKKLSTNDKLKVLEAQNQSLEERLKTLEDKVQSTAQAVHMASPVVAPNPQDQVGPTGGGFEEESVATTSGDYFDTEPRFLVFKGANGAEFKLGGYFWSDLNINNQSFSVNQGVTLPPTYINGLVANNDNAFTKMKSHLDFRVSFDKFVGGAIGLESDKHSSINVGFYHAYLTVKFDKFLRFRAGKFTNPLSLEGDQPSAVLPFVEPSMVADLAVNKDFGAMLNGKVGDDLFEYWLEVANGQQDNESSATGPDPDGLSD
ncbi:MAG TPA: porin, partial [bacterium]